MERQQKNMTLQWFALRVPYSRERKLKSFLEEEGISNFLPMKYKWESGKKKTLVPAIHNLIFVNSSQNVIDELIMELKFRIPIYYLIDRAKNQPIVVPERQMESFIAVAGTNDDRILFLKNIPIKIQNGDKVRVTDGIFKGVEGNIIRIKGDRRVVVSVDGFMAVATAFIHPSLLQKI